ncbi:BCS1-like ATPase [Penicillium verhagenii]|nr:BCS1-like ATPase [Penicillium verhagenii]
MEFNASIPSSTGNPSPETIMLEALIPGYALFSRILFSYLHIDLTVHIQQLVGMIVFGASVKFVVSYITDFVKEYLVSTAEIRLDDETFSYFMYWISRQPHMKRTNRFVAGVKSNSYCSDSDDSEDDDNLANDEGEWDEPGSADGISFDEYWAKVIIRDKYKPLRFTPSQGQHIFWWKNRPLMLERRNQTSSHRYVLNNERLYLSCLGRDASILRAVLNEAQQAYVQRDGNRTIIYRGHRYHHGGSWNWTRCMARLPRPLSTVVLDPDRKLEFVDDIKEYLHPRTRRWYSNRGIPYRRGYLLHGPPGTGKTSLCFAAAGLFGLKLYLLNLNSKALDEDSLASLFSELPNRCIVLLEDVDTAGITQNRGKTVTDSKLKETEIDEADIEEIPADKVDAVAVRKAARPAKPAPDGITLSGLLNVIDGVAASEGRILVMTSNHPENLDAALLRPGRVDMSISFGYTGEKAIEELFSSIYMKMDGDSPSHLYRTRTCETSK